MSDPELTPQEQRVRDLLADARHDEPMPSDVADRLDRVLADLHDGPAAPVSDLAAARRRRQRLRTGLVAAAAVVVLGVAVTQLDLSTPGTEDTASSGSAADSAESDAGGLSSLESERPAESAPGAASLPRSGIVLESQGLETQMADLLRNGGIQSYENYAYRGDTGASAQDSACTRPARDTDARGAWVLAEYDGKPVALVLRPPADGVRIVDLYACSDATLLRSVAVPTD